VKSDQRRAQILAAATQVFSEHGYEKASVAKICAAIGIARGTLYQYFRDKQSVFVALVDEQVEQVQEFARPIDWQASDCPAPSEALYERHVLIFELIYQHQDVFRLMVREARARNPETEDRVRKAQRRIVSTMAAELEAGTRAGHYRCPDPEFTAAYFFGGIVEIVEWNLFLAATPLDPKLLARKVTNLQLAVLLPPEEGEPR